MKKTTWLLLCILLLQHYSATAQSFAINTDGSTANTSAILDIKSTTKGILIPRMTLAERNLVAAPATGLMIYQTNSTPGFYYYEGAAWVSVISSANNTWLRSGASIYNNNTGFVGIGTTNPQSLLQVRNGTVVFDGIGGTTPSLGAGTRMMWIPSRSAFRAGSIPGGHWDDVFIGDYSTATGFGTIANGDLSTAIGLYSTASGYSSTAIGSYSTAIGSYSTAIGYSSTASGYIASAYGSANMASGDHATAMGAFTKSKSFRGFTVGTYNDSSNAASSIGINGLNRIFQIGNGTADNARSNAMTVLQNGNVGIGVLNPRHNLVVANAICVDDKDLNDGDTANALRFGAYYTGESIGSKRTLGGNHWGLDFITNYVNRMVITNGGNVGIGVYSPARKLSVATDIAVDENNTNTGTISGSLHFGAGNSGEAIGSKRNAGGNLFGLDFYTNSAIRLSITNGGNVGIGTTAPSQTLDVNGTTTTNGLQVSNGTVITKIQSGSALVGSSPTAQRIVTLIFPVAFASGTPRVFATARNEPGFPLADAFSVSVRSITSTSVTLNIQRTDAITGWGQQLYLDWFAVE